jgi:hypothetical protein
MKTLNVVFDDEEIVILERAIERTRAKNQREALIMIAREYLKHEKSKKL